VLVIPYFHTYGKAQPDTIPGEGSVDFLRHVEAVESSVVPERPAVFIFYKNFGLRPVLLLLGRIEAFAIDARELAESGLQAVSDNNQLATIRFMQITLSAVYTSNHERVHAPVNSLKDGK
jgi:hypothetical protein